MKTNTLTPELQHRDAYWCGINRICICLNLARVVTFLAQGIHPVTWCEKDGCRSHAHRHQPVSEIVAGIRDLILLFVGAKGTKGFKPFAAQDGLNLNRIKGVQNDHSI